LKLPALRAGLPGHASGEQNVSKGSFVHIVPLDPAYEAGLAGHVPVKTQNSKLKVASNNYQFVTPAQAGVQYC
jgi:hypothetical protein